MSFNNIYDSNQNYQSQQQPQFPQRSKNSSQLWMGELDPWWDENTIKSIWSQFGFNVINVKLIKEKFIQQQQGSNGYNNAGYCFVEFPSLEMASNALQSNGAKIANTNRFLKLNWASGASSQPQQNQQLQQQSQSQFQGGRGNEVSIFVGDLSPDVTDAVLLDFFGSKYQSVSGTKIMIDQITNKSKGYGFVRFLNEADQQRSLVEMQGAILNGRPIRVSTAVPKTRPPFGQVQGQAPFRQQQLQQSQLQQQTNTPVTSQSQQILSSFDSQYQPPLTQFTDPNNTTVFIGGLSSLVTEEELRLYFQPFGDITYVKIPIGKGCGFVQYVTRGSAELAIFKMQGYPIGNSRIRLSWGRSNANPKPQAYKPQPELPVLYGYQPQTQPLQQIPHPQFDQSLQQQGQPSLPAPVGNNFGVQQIQQGQFQTEQSETIDQSRLNQLFLAARDGRLDAIDSAANGYVFT